MQNIFFCRICNNVGRLLNNLSIHLLRLARVISEEIDDQCVVALFHLVDNLDNGNILEFPTEKEISRQTVSLH